MKKNALKLEVSLIASEAIMRSFSDSLKREREFPGEKTVLSLRKNVLLTRTALDFVEKYLNKLETDYGSRPKKKKALSRSFEFAKWRDARVGGNSEKEYRNMEGCSDYPEDGRSDEEE